MAQPNFCTPKTLRFMHETEIKLAQSQPQPHLHAEKVIDPSSSNARTRVALHRVAKLGLKRDTAVWWESGRHETSNKLKKDVE